MPVKLSQSPDRPDEWQVSRDETVIVRFSGPRAHEQARQRSQELADLLDEGGVSGRSMAVQGAELNATPK